MRLWGRFHTASPMTKTTMLRLLAAALLPAACLPAHALDLRPDGVSLERGYGSRAPRMIGVGMIWDWDFKRVRRAEVTAQTEVLINRWDIDPAAGNRHMLEYVVLPSLKMRLDRGASPFYLEVGIGFSWLDHEYRTYLEKMATRWNFYDMVGVGYTFGGPQGKNELALRWVHTSNAGLKNPNPGQSFGQLRFVRRF